MVLRFRITLNIIVRIRVGVRILTLILTLILTVHVLSLVIFWPNPQQFFFPKTYQVNKILNLTAPVSTRLPGLLVTRSQWLRSSADRCGAPNRCATLGIFSRGFVVDNGRVPVHDRFIYTVTSVLQSFLTAPKLQSNPTPIPLWIHWTEQVDNKCKSEAFL